VIDPGHLPVEGETPQERGTVPTRSAYSDSRFPAKPTTIPKASAAIARRGVPRACRAGCWAHWPRP